MSHESPIVEKSILSLMLQDVRHRRLIRGEGITSNHFVTYRQIFEAMATLDQAGTQIDSATLSHELTRHGQISEVGGFSEMEALSRFVSDTSNWTTWIAALREAYTVRVSHEMGQWHGTVSDAASAILAAKTGYELILDSARGPSRSKPALNATHDFFVNLERLHACGDLPGLSTGIPVLDHWSGGMRPGEFWVCLAKTSRGKTVLMMQIAAASYLQNKKTAIFSAEMFAHDLVGRMISNVGKVPMGLITQPKQLTKEGVARIRVTMDKLKVAPFWIDDTPSMSLEHIETEAQRLADSHEGLDLVVVDYIQILRVMDVKGRSREQQVASITNGLKQMAKRLGCPVLSAAQLNKQAEARESASVEFDADALLFITEDGIKIGKLRNGRRDDVIPYTLDGEYQRFCYNSDKDEKSKQN